MNTSRMRFLPFILGCMLFACQSTPHSSEPPARPDYVLVIHGGAGTILKENMSEEKEQSIRAALQEALDTGSAILAAGGSSVDAIEATLHTLEDNPLFNAGRGAVFTHAGTNELDASMMEGATLNAGAVAGVRTVRHPISAARAVMEHSPHVMLSGEGADLFAKEQGLEIVDPSFFHTDTRFEQLQKLKEGASIEAPGVDHKFGTVGAVALDKQGNLAAATSTGGMSNKRYGRIGDSPIIGAGTYANNATCAISCTGHGEFFIRNVVAYSVSAMMASGGLSLSAAADSVIMGILLPQGGEGGLIAVDKEGNFAMPFNTPGMYRAYVTADGRTGIGIYGE